MDPKSRTKDFWGAVHLGVRDFYHKCPVDVGPRLGEVAMSQEVDLTRITLIALICFAIISEISVWLRQTNLFDLLRNRHVSGH